MNGKHVPGYSLIKYGIKYLKLINMLDPWGLSPDRDSIRESLDT